MIIQFQMKNVLSIYVLISFFLEDVGKVDLHCEKNNTAHKTNDISVNRLIVRRGQSFLVTFELHGPSRPTTDLLELKVETGELSRIENRITLFIAAIY